jgi:hypothetical protein
MIRYCYDLSSELRCPDYFDRINLQKWATSYMMAISFFQIGEHNRSRMVEVESMQFARLLDLHRISGYDGLNCIETQLRKKAFWLMFYGYVYVFHKFKLRQIVTGVWQTFSITESQERAAYLLGYSPPEYDKP